jgi:hypothetical protein
MLNEKALSRIKSSLQRIFTMKITRSTFREVQNAIIGSAGDNKDLVNNLFECFLTGTTKESVVEKDSESIFQTILDEFSIPIRLSKEVHERGEFVNIITSDTLTQGDKIAFLNRIRRIDGEEFHFVTDTESTIHLLNHFIGRLQELDKSETTQDILSGHKEDLVKLKERVELAIK